MLDVQLCAFEHNPCRNGWGYGTVLGGLRDGPRGSCPFWALIWEMAQARNHCANTTLLFVILGSFYFGANLDVHFWNGPG